MTPPAVSGAVVAVGGSDDISDSVGARQAAEPLARGSAREAAGEEVVRPAQSQLGDGGRAPAQQAPPLGGGRAGRRGAVVVVLEEEVVEEEGLLLLLEQVRETPGSAAAGGHWDGWIGGNGIASECNCVAGGSYQLVNEGRHPSHSRL